MLNEQGYEPSTKSVDPLDQAVEAAYKNGLKYSDMQQLETLGMITVNGSNIIFKDRRATTMFAK